MKLNKLRNIIKESINQLMEEQCYCSTDGSKVNISGCSPCTLECCQEAGYDEVWSGAPMQGGNRKKPITKNPSLRVNEQPVPSGNYWQYNIGNCFDWAGIWTNTQPFTNPSNPNNPCNHICSRITHWTNLSSTTTDPARISRLKCKIQHGWDQYGIHGCASVSSNYCPL